MHGPYARLQRGHDLYVSPATQARFLVGCEIGTMERSQPGNLEADFGAAEGARHIGLAQEVTWRVAILATAEVHEILATRGRGIVGACCY